MNCVLEKMNLSFADDVFMALNDRRVTDNLRDLPQPYTLDDARRFILSSATDADNDRFVFAITVKGKFVGCISALRQQNIHCRTAEIGYYVTPEFWGNGIATQALKKLVGFVFEHTDLIRLFAEPFARNTASCRVLEKAGFTCEGTLRSNAVKNGTIEDMKMYSYIKS